MTTLVCGMGCKPRTTRYDELGYVMQEKGLWRLVMMEDGSVFGPHYKSKAELLADLDSQAYQFGCDKAVKPSTDLRLRIFGYHAASFFFEDAPAAFTLHPCEGVEAQVEITPAEGAFKGQRVWDGVTINGKSCGNRHGGLKAFCAMVDRVNPVILSEIADMDAFEAAMLPPCKPE